MTTTLEAQWLTIDIDIAERCLSSSTCEETRAGVIRFWSQETRNN